MIELSRKKKMIPYINKCSSCGKETGMFMISQWFWGLIKRVHCMEGVNKKYEKGQKKLDKKCIKYLKKRGKRE